jgi:hypothetical protein
MGACRRGNHLGLLPQHCTEAVEHAINRIDRAVKQAGLHTVDGVRANHPLGFADFHARKFRCALKKSFRCDPDSRHNDPTQVLALSRNAIERDGRAQIDDDARTAIFLKSGDGIRDAIGPQFLRRIHQNCHSGANARAQKGRFHLEIFSRGLCQH